MKNKYVFIKEISKFFPRIKIGDELDWESSEGCYIIKRMSILSSPLIGRSQLRELIKGKWVKKYEK